MDIKQLLTGGGAGDLQKLLKSLTGGGELDWNQVPSLARILGLPKDEIDCLEAITENIAADIKNPKRGTRVIMVDMINNYHMVGPEHFFYAAFRLIEEAHSRFSQPVEQPTKEEEVEGD